VNVNGEEPPARVLGRYALYDKIAAGGMAAVHLGRLLGPSGFARTVAIKRLHAQFAEDPEFVSMLLDEARMVARISHPNVVPTLDIVSTDGEVFLVMEYVHGESLARLSRAAEEAGARLPPEMAVTLMIGVLHGLHAAHEACSDRGEPMGIVHRDVSPQNILVGVDGAARVLDFGVAKCVGRLQTTREGQLKGKLSYMAPEQIRGKVSRASDVYAASIVLWELLAGRRLFDGKNEGQILDRVIRGCQKPPSAVATGISPALDAATLRGLSVDPAKRFSTARDMARALEDTGAHAPASKIGEWVESMMTEQLRERRTRIVAIERESASATPNEAPGTREPEDDVDAPTEPAMAPPARSSPVSDQPGSTSVPVTEEVLHTQLSSASISGISRAAAPRVAPRVAVGAVVAIAASALVVSWLRHAPDASPTAANLVVAAAPDPSSLPAPPLDSAEPAPAAPPGLPLPAASPSRPPAQPARRAPAPAAPPSRTHCNPPWTFDSRGVQSFKRECL
jgi:serine/threonine protein kinase